MLVVKWGILTLAKTQQKHAKLIQQRSYEDYERLLYRNQKRKGAGRKHGCPNSLYPVSFWVVDWLSLDEPITLNDLQLSFLSDTNAPQGVMYLCPKPPKSLLLSSQFVLLTSPFSISHTCLQAKRPWWNRGSQMHPGIGMILRMTLQKWRSAREIYCAKPDLAP